MKYLRHCLVGLFLLTGACGGPIEEESPETPAPGSEAGQEGASDNGGPTSQALCDYQYSYGTCGSCSIAASTAPGEVAALAYPGQTSRRRYCCYTNGTSSCGSWQSMGCRAC